MVIDLILHRLTTTVLVSAFAFGASIVAATLSGMAASFGVLPGCEKSENGKSCKVAVYIYVNFVILIV